MKRLYIGIWVFLSALFMVQAQESGTRSPRILGLDCRDTCEVNMYSGSCYCYWRLKSLDVSGCTALTSLDCSYSDSLTSLDVSGCTSLTSFVVSDCKSLMSLDVSGCTSLTSLDVSGCTSLTSLDVSGCTSLTSFVVNFCKSLMSLDVSGCTALTSLDCGFNQLTELDVSANTALTELDCGYNQLTELDVNANTALTSLNCGSNELRSLDVSANTALTSLDCGGNQLTELDVNANTALTSLSFGFNRLIDIDVSGCTVLSYMNCEGNIIPLSTLYTLQHDVPSRRVWGQREWDSVVLLRGEDFDLSSEYRIGNTLSTYRVRSNLNSQLINAADVLKEQGFVFQFNKGFFNGGTYRLEIENKAINDYEYEFFMWYVIVLDTLPTDYLTITAAPNHVEGGTVSMRHNNGRYKIGSTAIIAARPQPDCRFVNWTKQDGSVFSTEAVHTFTAMESMELTANFENRYTLDLSSNNIELGCVSRTDEGISQVTITATPNEGCRFLSWTKQDGSVFSTEAEYTFKVTEDIVLTANFEKIPTYSVSLSVNDSSYGSVSGAGTYKEKTEVTIKASPNSGYYFVNWTEQDGSAAGTRTQYTFAVTENIELIANFKKYYSVRLSANNSSYGRVSGSGTYQEKTEVTIKATPRSAYYRFINWTRPDGSVFSTEAEYTFTVTGDTVLTANFEKVPTYSVSFSANSSYYGSVSGAGSYPEKTEVTIKATPRSANYRFINWTRPDGSVFSNEAEYTFTITEDIELTANFERLYSVELADGFGGAVSQTGNGIYGKGTEVTITATPDDGYRFVKWMIWDDYGYEEVFATEAEYTFTVTEDIILVAYFEKIPYCVRLSSNIDGYGNVFQTGNGTYQEGSQVTITATPNNGYRFVDWTSKDGTVFSTEAIHTFAVMENMELTANFEEVPRYTVQVVCHNPEWGTATMTGSGTYEEGTQVTITATPNAGYRFVNWTRKNGTVFATVAVHTFIVTEDVELTANFEEVPRYTVGVASNNSRWGTAVMTGNGIYEEGSQVTITATPNNGYRFVNWTRKNGTVFATEAVHTFTVMENMELTANFEKVPEEVETFTVVLMANNAGWGSVYQTGDGAYEEGKEITIIATPKEGYRFVNWTKKNGEVFSTEAVHTFMVMENLELTANFEKIPEEVENFRVVLATNNNAYGIVSQSGNGTYEEGSQVTITAMPNNGYRFVNWTRKNGAMFATEAVHTFTVTENMELTANFEKIPDVVNENREDDNFYVYIQDHTIHLSDGRGVARVYNAAGVCVYSGESTAIPVQNSGLYIVRIGERAYKAMVR